MGASKKNKAEKIKESKGLILEFSSLSYVSDTLVEH